MHYLKRNTFRVVRHNHNSLECRERNHRKGASEASEVDVSGDGVVYDLDDLHGLPVSELHVLELELPILFLQVHDRL